MKETEEKKKKTRNRKNIKNPKELFWQQERKKEVLKDELKMSQSKIVKMNWGWENICQENNRRERRKKGMERESKGKVETERKKEGKIIVMKKERKRNCNSKRKQT